MELLASTGTCSLTFCSSFSREAASSSKGFGSKSISNNNLSIASIIFEAARASGISSSTSAKRPKTLIDRNLPSLSITPVKPPIVPNSKGVTFASAIHCLEDSVDVIP